MPETEREFETGMDEGFKQVAVSTAKQGLQDLSAVNVVALQALQNAVETANMVSKNAVVNVDLITKQCIRHNDIAIDCIWDPGPGEESLKK